MDRRRQTVLFGLLMAALAAACAHQPSAPALSPGLLDRLRGARMIDLTHTLSPAFPFIPVKDATFPFRISPIATIAQRGVYANKWELTEHNGTHIDAPSHFWEGGHHLPAIPLQDLIAPAVVIDIRQRAATDPDARVEMTDLAAWERRHGRIPARAVVLMLSGWQSRAGSAEAFVNGDGQGTLHFPGFALEVIDHLVRDRQVVGVGVDTLSIDPGNDPRYQGHRLLARANRWALECLASLDALPPSGAILVVGASKVAQASGGPARVLAFVEAAD
jgi:kynurenine formamidase